MQYFAVIKGGYAMAQALLIGIRERPSPPWGQDAKIWRERLFMMMTAAKIVVDVVLDEETLSEIEMLRSIRLKHYEQMANNPEAALETLKRAGLREESSVAQVAANAYAKVVELKSRLSQRDVVYEDELSLYVNSLSVDEEE